MKSTLSSEASAALDALVMKWTEFGNDVDRALAVTAVAKLKVSSRVLAEKLGCGATHIRNYLLMAKATPKDQLLARTSEISSRELVRRSRNAVAERKATDRKAIDQSRIEAAQEACKTICDWLEGEKLWPSQCENIIDETRRILWVSTQDGTQPKCNPPATGTPVEKIIERMRPPKCVDYDTGTAEWYAAWLTRWAFFAFLDEIVRDRALNMALNVQIRRM